MLLKLLLILTCATCSNSFMIQRYRGASSIWARKQQGGGDFLDVPTPKPEAKPAKKARTTKGTKVKDSSKSKSNAKIKDPNGEIQSDGDMFDDKRQALASLLEMLMEQADETGMLGSSSIGKGQKQLSSILSNENSGVEDPEILNGVIRVYCTHSQPNFGMPWQRQKQEFSTSTGFVIDGNRILTNAHAVEYGSLVQVKKRQSEDKYTAKVVAVGHECDLAILEVQEASFWKDLKPLKFGNIPDLLEDVSVIGYPVGGDSISITSGVVSRIEMQEYAQASAELLAIQIDAAINPGNSGGPVLSASGKVIGVAFQSLSEDDVENIGYVVPVNVINHFLDDVRRHGSYSGVCGVGVHLQAMENEQLRKHYKMKDNKDTGVLIVSIASLAPASQVLQKGDVVMSIDGIRIANDGTIPFREGRGKFKERVHLSYYFTQRFASDHVSFEILRNGKRMMVSVPLWVPQHLVPRVLLQKKKEQGNTLAESSIIGGVPSYLMVGGLVLVALSREYLQTEFNVERMGDLEGWAEEFRLISLIDKKQQKEGEEVVLLSQVIAHACNIGYETHRNLRLVSFNGKHVVNLAQLKKDIEKAKTSLVFEFCNGQVLVLDSKAAMNAREQICNDHFLPSYCSADLL